MKNLKKILFAALVVIMPVATSWADAAWEKEGGYYFLTKENRAYFKASGAGPNKFITEYLTYEGVDFLVRGAVDWQDYGRLDLTGNNIFFVPIRSGMKVEEVHLLAGGSYSNSYKEDPLLKLYGDNYYYSVITVVFAYQDGTFRSLSVPVFWDWFHLGMREWSRDGARIKGLGDNPVRRNCSMYHLTFINPLPARPLIKILVSDSWLSDMPFSDVFAVTLKSGDMFDGKIGDSEDSGLNDYGSNSRPTITERSYQQ